jgi:hypothetical protein
MNVCDQRLPAAQLLVLDGVSSLITDFFVRAVKHILGGSGSL